MSTISSEGPKTHLDFLKAALAAPAELREGILQKGIDAGYATDRLTLMSGDLPQGNTGQKTIRWKFKESPHMIDIDCSAHMNTKDLAAAAMQELCQMLLVKAVQNPGLVLARDAGGVPK